MVKTPLEKWKKSILKYKKQCQTILEISNNIRYVGVINNYGRTFTGVIQRYRQKDFKFMWDEIPPTPGPWNEEKTKIDVSYRFKNCEMIESKEGYFSWNRINYSGINAAWMREWKESFE